MRSTPWSGRLAGALTCLIVSVSVSVSAWAAAPGATACDDRANVDPAACARETAAARAAAGRGTLTEPESTEQQRNATARCNALPQADRQDCLARVKGEGSTSGSVSSGGIYRETVTRVPAPPGPALVPTPTAPAGK